MSVVLAVLADIAPNGAPPLPPPPSPSDSGRAKNANGNNFTVGFLEVDTRDEPRTGHTSPRRNNALAMLFINFRATRGVSFAKSANNSENGDGMQ